MGQAADEISTKQLRPKRFLPVPDETAGEINRRSPGTSVGIGVCHRVHDLTLGDATNFILRRIKKGSADPAV